jgi:hypothetical protein
MIDGIKKRNLLLSIVALLAIPGSLSAVAAQLTLPSHNAQGELPTLIQGNITAALSHKPFGGERIGTYAVILLGQKIGINIYLHLLPEPGYIFEARLADTKTHSYLNLGQFNTTITLLLSQNKLNLFQYNLIIITQQVANTVDLKHSQPIGGAILKTPFGNNFIF